MARYTQRELARRYLAARKIDPTAVASVRLVAVPGDKSLRFGAFMDVDGTEHEVAADNGKAKVFTNVDDFLKFAAKAAETSDGVYRIEVDTGLLLASSVPSNMVTWAQSRIASLTAIQGKQQMVINGIDSQLAMMTGWENGNVAQVAKKSEIQAQRAAVVTDIAACDAEITRLQGLIDGAGA